MPYKSTYWVTVLTDVKYEAVDYTRVAEELVAGLHAALGSWESILACIGEVVDVCTDVDVKQIEMDGQVVARAAIVVDHTEKIKFDKKALEDLVKTQVTVPFKLNKRVVRD